MGKTSSGEPKPRHAGPAAQEGNVNRFLRRSDDKATRLAAIATTSTGTMLNPYDERSQRTTRKITNPPATARSPHRITLPARTAIANRS